MKKIKRASFALLIIAFCLTALGGCGKKKEEGSVAYGDIVYDVLSLENMREGLSAQIEDRPYVEMIKTYEASNAWLLSLGVSDSALSAYGEDYYKTNDLLAIGLWINSAFKYSVDDLILKDEVLTVCVNEKAPSDHTGLASVLGILIDIPKGGAPDGVEIKVEKSTVFEDWILSGPFMFYDKIRRQKF